MLTTDDLNSLRGQTIADAERHERSGREILRLHLQGGGILAITGDESGLNVADESSIP
jgi:hypothetical protein